MDNTVGFYPSNGSSILSRQANHAREVELVYTQDLKSCAVRIEGSSPSSRTKRTLEILGILQEECAEVIQEVSKS